MKKLLIASLIASGFVAAGAQAATANLVINATVSSKCTISTAPAAINLTIDPSTVAGPTTGTSNFGFPFVMAVKGRTRQEILDALEQRLARTGQQELDQCLTEIDKIAWIRLSALANARQQG